MGRDRERPPAVALGSAACAPVAPVIGSIAAAAASAPGPSRVDSRAPAWRHQARHNSPAAITQGVPNTAIPIARSSRSWAVSGSSALTIIWTHR